MSKVVSQEDWQKLQLDEAEDRKVYLSELLCTDHTKIGILGYDGVIYKKYAHRGEHYLVLSNFEAQDELSKVVKKKLHEIDPLYIAKRSIKETDSKVIEEIQKFGPKANFILKQIVGDKFDDLLSDLVFSNAHSSRGDFLACDGEELQNGKYFIYRVL